MNAHLVTISCVQILTFVYLVPRVKQQSLHNKAQSINLLFNGVLCDCVAWPTFSEHMLAVWKSQRMSKPIVYDYLLAVRTILKNNAACTCIFIALYIFNL